VSYDPTENGNLEEDAHDYGLLSLEQRDEQDGIQVRHVVAHNHRGPDVVYFFGYPNRQPRDNGLCQPEKTAEKEVGELLEARLPIPGEQQNRQIERKETHQKAQCKVQCQHRHGQYVYRCLDELEVPGHAVMIRGSFLMKKYRSN